MSNSSKVWTYGSNDPWQRDPETSGCADGYRVAPGIRIRDDHLGGLTEGRAESVLIKLTAVGQGWSVAARNVMVFRRAAIGQRQTSGLSGGLLLERDGRGGTEGYMPKNNQHRSAPADRKKFHANVFHVQTNSSVSAATLSKWDSCYPEKWSDGASWRNKSNRLVELVNVRSGDYSRIQFPRSKTWTAPLGVLARGGERGHK